MKKVLLFLLLAGIQFSTSAQTASNISDYDGMIWAEYDNVKIVVSEPSNRLYVVKDDESTAYLNVTVQRTECDITAVSDRIFYCLDFMSGSAALFITTKKVYYAGGNN